MDFDIVADVHIFADKDILPNGTVLADVYLRHYMAEVPDLGALANVTRLFY